jgi:uncharacterized protein (UPF0333 family)
MLNSLKGLSVIYKLEYKLLLFNVVITIEIHTSYLLRQQSGEVDY